MILFGIKRKIYRLRKKYDKLREKSDKMEESELKNRILKSLDNVEPNLRIIEEEKMSRFETKKMLNRIDEGIEIAKEMIDGTYENNTEMR